MFGRSPVLHSNSSNFCNRGKFISTIFFWDIWHLRKTCPRDLCLGKRHTPKGSQAWIAFFVLSISKLNGEHVFCKSKFQPLLFKLINTSDKNWGSINQWNHVQESYDWTDNTHSKYFVISNIYYVTMMDLFFCNCSSLLDNLSKSSFIESL